MLKLNNAGALIRQLAPGEIDRELFAGFDRRQAVDKCLRYTGGQLRIVSDPFIDDWSEEEYLELVERLRRAIRGGGVVYGAFIDGRLKGFCCVEGTPFGDPPEYLDLSHIHVSAETRGRGVGRLLFTKAAKWAAARGAKKLYISAHSAVESQAFYISMGCVDAREPSARHALEEPCDRQMEFALHCGLSDTEV